MSTEHDDDGLDEFADSDLVRALRAPGTPDELAGEARFVAAFRDAHRTEAVRGRAALGGRVAGRIGVGGAALLAAVTLTGGVAAAAYTRHLPHPVQVIAHDTFGAVGVPPAPPVAPRTKAPRPTATPDPDPTTGESADERRPPQPTRSAGPGDQRSPRSDGPTSATSAATGTDAPSTDPAAGTASGFPGGPTGPTGPTSPGSDDPSTDVPASPAVTPTRVGATASARRVTTGGHATVTAIVRDHGELVEGAEVWLLQRRGTDGWTRTASAVTGEDGSAIFATGPLTETTTFRFAVDVDEDADGDPDRVLSSRKRRIGVQPLLTLSAAGPILTVHAVGAGAGEAVTVSRRTADGRVVRIGIRRLDDQGSASYDLSSYPGRVRVLVRILRTSTHTAVRRWITVRVPRKAPPTATPTPTPTPSTSPSAEPSGTASSSTTTGS
ncbi:hypothetical protein FHP29_07705 [Nocardioides albidus]|uniref:Uncharacterized protein n=1 Tax=Nocardioides albidus TaxID=1517589 RepID=A0A5C4W431_9ACTN|nr:hypothetical protein [Nocardioides albidus]TNM42872.1 hypothetical protein FHP29_07705 [Nocardioides albidus]